MKPLMKYHVTLETQDGKRIKTWGVLPVSSETKILDGIYNPEAKELSLLLDSTTEQYTEFPIKAKNGKWEVQQRKLDQYYRLRVTGEDLPYFLETYVDNNFEMEAVIEEPSKIITEES